MRKRKESGVVLGIVLVLIACVLTAGVYAFWSLQGESGSAASDRLSRQLLDCAEQGLAIGKAYFSSSTMSSAVWVTYYQADGTKICGTTPGTLPCPPFPNKLASNPQTGTPPANYPGGAPFYGTVTMPCPTGTCPTYSYTFGIYNNPDDSGAASNPITENDSNFVVYSRCFDDVAGGNPLHSRSVSAVIHVNATNTTDYTGQAGRGFRNQGNSNL